MIFHAWIIEPKLWKQMDTGEKVKLAFGATAASLFEMTTYFLKVIWKDFVMLIMHSAENDDQ